MRLILGGAFLLVVTSLATGMTNSQRTSTDTDMYLGTKHVGSISGGPA
jgi:Na+(H+)/acetate symporter ActP